MGKAGSVSSSPGDKPVCACDEVHHERKGKHEDVDAKHLWGRERGGERETDQDGGKKIQITQD